MNQAGIDLLKHFEGFSGVAYPDPGTGGDPWTIGYGFTKGVKPGDMMSLDEAEDRLKQEMAEFEQGVEDACTNQPNANQLAALTCLAYNIGLGAFKGSTVLRKHNAGDTEGAADAFLMWNRAGGHEMQGLINRRKAERALYLS